VAGALSQPWGQCGECCGCGEGRTRQESESGHKRTLFVHLLLAPCLFTMRPQHSSAFFILQRCQRPRHLPLLRPVHCQSLGQGRFGQRQLQHHAPGPFYCRTDVLFDDCRLSLSTRMLSTLNTSPSIQPNSDMNDEIREDETATSASEQPNAAGLQQRINLAASRAQTPLSIAQCLKLGYSLSTKSLLKNLMFLNRELPVRFSKRIVELDHLPSELRATEPITNLVKNYSLSFEELQTSSDNSRLWYGQKN
jgi:hypothetical protein